MDIHGPVIHIAVFPPDPREQGLPVEDPAPVRGQQGEQVELLARKGQGVTVFEDFAPVGIDLQVVHHDSLVLLHCQTVPLGFGKAGTSAQVGMDTGHQLAHREGLDDIIVRARVEAEQAVGLGGAGGQEQNRKGSIVAVQAAAQVQPAAGGQHNIQQDEVRATGQKTVHALVGITRRLDIEPLFFEVVGNGINNRLFIIHDQYL